MIELIVLAAALASDCGAPARLASGGDYLNPSDRSKLKVVEQFHFNADVEALRRGQSGSIGGDIGYTLERFPNHHRALSAMARLALRDKSPQPRGAAYPVDCYFLRALSMNARDAQVRSTYAAYLLAAKREEEALAQLQAVIEADPENATAHYNLGLLHFKRKDYDRARSHADEAYARGFPLEGLKNKLATVNK
ncbi:tetratricopeptide repeat protein [Pseudoduganella sp. GCM10020061]|uniref:tetratricopeptide repeat protein n=1 Tax=Pseudoduganella sp. GCM10020061 TaxID=3317345 RepID=UPI003636A9A6